MLTDFSKFYLISIQKQNIIECARMKYVITTSGAIAHQRPGRSSQRDIYIGMKSLWNTRTWPHAASGSTEPRRPARSKRRICGPCSVAGRCGHCEQLNVDKTPVCTHQPRRPDVLWTYFSFCFFAYYLKDTLALLFPQRPF